MPLEDQLRQAFDRNAAELHARFDAGIAGLAEELTRLMAAERERLAREAEARIASARDRAHAQAQAQVTALKDEARRQVEELRHTADAQVAEVRRTLEELRTATRQQIEEARRAANADAEELVVSQLAAAAADNDRRTADAVAQTRAEADADMRGAAARLVDAVRALDNARTLGELLDYLVESAGREAERAAVFVAKGGRLHGWRLVGFAPDLPPAKSIELAPTELEPPPFARTAEARDYVTLPIQVGGAPVAVLYADMTAGRGDLARLRAHLEVWSRYVGRALEAMTVTRASGLMQ